MDLKKRKNHRLKSYDYSNSGYYYITVCTNKMKCLLCTIEETTEENSVEENNLRTIFNNPLVLAGSTRTFVKVSPSPIGKLVAESIYNIEKLNRNVKIDKFALMPNHIHCIIVIKQSETYSDLHKNYAFQINNKSIQGLIKDFKSVTTRKYKKLFNTNESLWQKSFYDEILESQKHYDKVWQYIEENPSIWLKDELNPANFDLSSL